MSDKASGNETEGRRDDDRELELPNTPEGEELSIDREAGDQPVSYTHLTLPTSDLV